MLSLPTVLPLAVLFDANDDDGVTGGVVHEKRLAAAGDLRAVSSPTGTVLFVR